MTLIALATAAGCGGNDDGQPTIDAAPGLDDAFVGDSVYFPFGSLPPFSVADLPDAIVDIAEACEIDTTAITVSCDVGSAEFTSISINTTEVAVFRARTIDVEAALRVRGTRPLVFIAQHITVAAAGSIEAGSLSGELAGDGGPGHRDCGDVNIDSGNDSGGAGGGFAGRGGDGGQGQGMGQPDPGVGGATSQVPPELTGGCRGGNVLTAPGQFRFGGLGGGALQLTATTLVIEGTVNVGGAGGAGGAGGGNNGGPGGGSGGMLVLDSPEKTLVGGIGFYGGGGGGGGELDGGGAGGGQPGDDGSPDRRGDGGSGASADGGDGGEPSSNSTSGDDGMGTDGAGGGGGGVGFLVDHDPLNPG